MLPMIGLWAIPWVRKFALYGAIVLVALWFGRQWLNSHDDKVSMEAKMWAFKEAEKDLIKRQIEVTKAVNDMREQLLLDRATLIAQQAETAKTRRAVESALDKILIAVNARRVQDDAKVDRVLAHELVGAVREQSNRLASPID